MSGGVLGSYPRDTYPVLQGVLAQYLGRVLEDVSKLPKKMGRVFEPVPKLPKPWVDKKPSDRTVIHLSLIHI